MADSWILRVPGPVGPPPKPVAVAPAPLPRCEHTRVDVRQRKQVNGIVVAVRQCVACGGHCGNVPKASVGDVTTLPHWDEELRTRYWNERSAESSAHYERQKLAEQEQWWAWYDAYLLSPQWRDLRAKVLARDAYQCNGCGAGRATQVHHLTYARVGREMLFDLVAVCDRCHDAIHTATESPK